MPKRKLAEEPVVEDSDLSPPPDGLLDEQAVAVTNGNARKRSASQGRKAKRVKTEIVEESVNGQEEVVGKGAGKKKRKTKVEAQQEVEERIVDGETSPKKRQRRKQEVKTEEVELDDNGEVAEKKVKKKRKSKAEKEADLVDMPLAARTVGHKLCIGAHVSSAGGVQNSILNSVHIGANAFALFLKSQRKWANPALSPEVADIFQANCTKHGYDQTQHVVPHGSYLVNLAHTDKARTEQAYDAFLDDLKRCERLGIRLYNFHPGNTVNNDRAAAIAHLASNINRGHEETSTVVTLLENMAAGGNVLGSTFEDLRDIIALVSNKQRVGVCLDTCHAFAAGYDLRSPSAFKATISHFDEVVGLDYLRALHLNDSKAPFAAHRDLHANIGTGFLGLRAFHNVVNEPRFGGLPLVLETPISVCDADGNLIKNDKGKEQEDTGIWAREIKLLESLVGIDVESEEFVKLEKALSRRGESERRRLMEQLERKKLKEGKKANSLMKKMKKQGKGGEDAEVDKDEDSPLSELEEEDEEDEEDIDGAVGDTHGLAG